MDEYSIDRMAVEEIGDKIANLTLAQAAELGRYLDEVHGIKVYQEVKQEIEEVKPEEPVKTEFDVVYEGFDESKKIAVIKAVREITGLGLKEAKDFVESNIGKKIKESLSKAAADELAAKIIDSGGKASVK